MSQPTPTAPGPELKLGGTRVAVVGLAKSGLAAIDLLRSRGAQVVAVDAKSEAELGPTAERLKAAGVELAVGGAGTEVLERAALVVVSPGVPLTIPPLARARQAGVPVMGEVELAWRCLPPRERLPAPGDVRARGAGQPAPCIGITGTNGKSTTTALTGELFAQGGGKIFVGGNLGRPLSEAAMEPGGFDAYVVELSSFQLEGISQARFQGAAILNLTPDHLDRYESHQAYGAAKARIFATQQEGDFAVVNGQDASVLELARAAKVPVYSFSVDDPVPRSGPAMAGGARVKGGGFELFDLGRNERVRLDPNEHFTVKNRALRGRHNLENAMAAALLARLSGVSAQAVQAGLDSYPGLPHRLESVRVLAGVEWINDSKATNVDSSLVALRAFDGNLWLIAGGKGKGAPYAPMVEASRGKVKGVLTVGQDAKTLEAAYQGVAKVYPCGTVAEAVQRARELAAEGDVVLLSPACASYDQFKNFEERGDTFKRLVRELS